MLVVPSWHIALSPSRIRIKNYELGKKGFHDVSNKSFIYYLYEDYASAYRDIRRRKEKAGSQRLIARTTFRGNNGLIVGRGSRSTMFIEARRKEGANYARERARRRGKVTRSTAWKQRPIEAKGRNNVVELYGSSVDDRVGACKTRITIDRTGHGSGNGSCDNNEKVGCRVSIPLTRFPVSTKPNRSEPRRCFLDAVYRGVETPGWSQHRSNVARTPPLLRTAFPSSFPRRTRKRKTK